MVVPFPEKGASRVFFGLAEAVRTWQVGCACWEGLRVSRLGDCVGLGFLT